MAGERLPPLPRPESRDGPAQTTHGRGIRTGGGVRARKTEVTGTGTSLRRAMSNGASSGASGVTILVDMDNTIADFDGASLPCAQKESAGRSPCTSQIRDGAAPVSYTHLTLPTICSV
eukprot:265331-Prymnesium_polylepis.1